jgi:hypothetical protein
MKVQYTTVVGVNSSQYYVEILIRPQGSEWSDEPQKVFISPHQNYLNLHFSGLGDKVIKPKQLCSNGAELHYVTPCKE